MIIHQIRLANFGIYGGEHHFDLTPTADGHFARAITLFIGKNGVGKTTLAEALRLCLHGSLVLGTRVAQREYDEYLSRRIHTGKEHLNNAAVELLFDYVSVGRSTNYRVLRAWQRKDNQVHKQLDIWEDGVRLITMEDEDKERLLREVVPPGLASLFFFDGEKVQTLTENGSATNTWLQNTVKSLLGLDIVDQLAQDLDLFVARQSKDEDVLALQNTLLRLQNEQATAQTNLHAHEVLSHDVQLEIQRTNDLIETNELRLSTEGGRLAAQRETIAARQRLLKSEVEVLRRDVMELCAGLVPFSITPKMLNAVATRLQVEKAAREKQIFNRLLQERLDALAQTFDDVAIREKIAPLQDEAIRTTLLQYIETSLLEPSHSGESSVVLDVSEREYHQLLDWIAQGQTEVPHLFSAMNAVLASKEAELKSVEHDIALTPTDVALQPLITQIQTLHQALGSLQRQAKDLEVQCQRLRYKIETIESQKRNIREQLTHIGVTDNRIGLATKTQTLLGLYQDRLVQRKLDELQQGIVRRFNELCRKDHLLDSVKVDPESFHVTLFRTGREIGRQQLSAGENQLFAIAVLWALREVSKRPLPILIDTPLGRLDTEHRTTLTTKFFPHVSHQLLIFATDAEVDAQIYSHLEPAIARTYYMRFDTKQSKTFVTTNSDDMNLWKDAV